MTADKIFDGGMSEAEKLRRQHAERLAAREQELRFTGVLKNPYDKIPFGKLIGTKPDKPNENEES